MRKHHFDDFMNIHETRNSLKQADVLSIEGNSKRGFQVTLSDTVINCDINNFSVLLMLGVGGLFLASFNIFLNGLVDQNFSKIALLLTINLKMASCL